jgi:hypothetical protein
VMTTFETAQCHNLEIHNVNLHHGWNFEFHKVKYVDVNGKIKLLRSSPYSRLLENGITESY